MNQKKCAFIFESPDKLKMQNKFPFPFDATAEWESQETVDIMISTWKEIGYNVIPLCIDSYFPGKWAKLFSQIDLVHSVVEGWGSFEREGWIASLCQFYGVPFIGSTSFVQSLLMHKQMFKTQAKTLNIPTPLGCFIRTENDLNNIPHNLLGQKVFLKPNYEGSGMGVYSKSVFEGNTKDLQRETLTLLKQFPEGVLLEKCLPGREFTTGFIGSPRQFLPIAEIEVTSGVYGLDNKSKDEMGEKVTFPKLSEESYRIMKEGTLAISEELDILDFCRFDWKEDENGVPHLMEANGLPGLSRIYSTLPLMAKKGGIPYQDLFKILGKSALRTKQERTLRYGKALLMHS